MMHDKPALALWHYTLQFNYWLNRLKPLEMLTGHARRSEASTIYDYTIWCGGKAVAAWSGTESDAFNTMLHLAARQEREAALLALLRGGGAAPLALSSEA